MNTARRSCLLLAVLGALAAPASAVEVLIPSYFYPSGAQNPWPRLNTAAGNVAITAILNPNSGPGAALDTNYRNANNALRAVGGRTIGYVSTDYANRSIALVKADVLKYTQLYDVDGFFLDEFTNASDATDLDYYAEVYSYIKSLNADFRVVGNPGTNTQPAYLTRPTTDALVTYETNTGYASWQPSPWTNAYATRRFSNLPYAIATEAAMVTAVNAAAAKRVGYTYVTDDGPDGNPWDRLPTYWDAEVAAIRAVTPTWNVAASGDWTTAANWTTSAAPNGVGAEALLLGVLAAPATLSADVDVTLGALVFNNANGYALAGTGTLSLDASAESALIDVRRGAHVIALPMTLRDPTGVFVAANSSLTVAGPATVVGASSLTKSGPGRLNFSSIFAGPDASLAVTSGTVALAAGGSIDTLVVAAGARAELSGGTLAIASVASDAAVRALIVSAYVGGAWTGPGLALAAPTAGRSLGYVTELQIDGRRSATIAVTLAGDANLDLNVNFADLLSLAQNYNATGRRWFEGDFDYDGSVNFADLLALAQNYNGSLPSGGQLVSLGGEAFATDWTLALSLVPEPTTLATLGVAGLTLRRRR